MARTANKTSLVLAHLYRQYFENDQYERYRIGWSELRSIAGIQSLSTQFLADLNEKLRRRGFLLIVCDNYFVIAGEDDFCADRTVPPRIIEQHLYEIDEDINEEDDDDDDDDWVDD